MYRTTCIASVLSFNLEQIREYVDLSIPPDAPKNTNTGWGILLNFQVHERTAHLVGASAKTLIKLEVNALMCTRRLTQTPRIAHIYIHLGFNSRHSMILHSGVDEFKSSFIHFLFEAEFNPRDWEPLSIGKKYD